MNFSFPKQVLLLILTGVILGSTSAQAQDDLRRVVTARSPMTKSLGGGQAGELLLNTKVNVIEEKGKWSKVSVEGWVRSKTLSAPSVAKQAPAPVTTPKVIQGALRVTEFVRNTRTDISPPREYVVLTVRNDSPRTIRSWSALLVALDSNESSVFRERVSEEDVEWKPNESRDVTFFWQPSESGYSSVTNIKKGEHHLVLLNVEIE